MKWGLWSTTAASNSNTPPDGWPEGQAPSTVNDCAREMMAQLRTAAQDMQFIDQGHVPTQTGGNTFTIPGNVVSFYDVGRRVKALDGGAGTVYGTVISASFTANTGVTLKFDVGNAPLTSSLSAVGVSILSPTSPSFPESSYRVRAVNVNGLLDVWQTGGGPFGLSGSAAGIYVADGWAVAQNASSVLNISRSERSAVGSNVPSVAQSGMLFNNSLLIQVSATDAAIASSDYARVSVPIEGYDFREIAQKPFSVQFWVASNVTGTYCMSVGNNTNRTYVSEFQISTSGIWEKKTFLVPESPSAGTWDYSTGVGLLVSVALAAGAAWQATANQWTSTVVLATSNQVNWLGTGGNAFRITGLKVNEGIYPAPYDTQDYWATLTKCKRYYQGISAGILMAGVAISTSRGLYTLPLEVEMRAAPTITMPAVSGLAIINGAGAAISVSAVNVGAITGTRAVEMDIVAVGTPLTQGQAGFFIVSAGNAIALSARL